MRYLHQSGICHRDISLSNIIYDHKSAKIKLIDFNVSKLIGHKGKMVTHTGTDHFKSPELFTQYSYDFSRDVWAIGVVIFSLVAKKLPFDDENQYLDGIIHKIQFEPPDPPIHSLPCSQ